MDRTRRRFVTAAAGAGIGATIAARLGVASSAFAAPGAGSQATILILGGTGFLGPAVVEAARRRGHKLTLFNRGKTNPGLFPDLETLHGDRDGHLEALAGRSWDAVVDTSGYVPRIVTASASLLAPRIKQYVFISTISVFKDGLKPGADESGPLNTVPDEKTEDVKQYYGALKALCEKAAEKAIPGRVCSIRPGLIVGPGDPTDRFTYWPVRLARGGEVLAPGDGTDPVQFVDVRDLGAFIVRAIETNIAGVYNATGPERRLTMRELLESSRTAIKSDARLTWVPADFLEKQKVEPWSDMPVWVPFRNGEEGFAAIDCRKAIGKGITFRLAAETSKDTLAWYGTLPEERRKKLRAGIAPDREAAVLAAWRGNGKKGAGSAAAPPT
ncbi:MAG: NAD-dependent epimerase/dehydratase family protein [Acidobacteriia bacterium]|nr:NAD-dependent epimerase/dehydratase family protein [Terriglobia bacterium]